MIQSSFHFGLVAIFIAFLGLLVPLYASAAKTRNVDFEQYTYEIVPGNSQSLRGVDAFVKCPDGSTVSGPLFDFEATSDRPTSSGTWRMIAAPGAAAGDGGTVEQGLIGRTHYRLTATLDDPQNRGKSVICPDVPIPTEVVIKGYCGVGVTVKFEASNGMIGRFKGDVSCP